MSIEDMKVTTVCIPLKKFKQGEGFITVGQIMQVQDHATKDTLAIACPTRNRDVAIVEPDKPFNSGDTILCHDQEGVFLKLMNVDNDGAVSFTTHPDCVEIARPLNIFCIFAVTTAGLSYR